MAIDTYVENRDILKHSQYLSSHLFNRSLSAEERDCVKPLQSQSLPSEGLSNKAKRRENISMFKVYLLEKSQEKADPLR